MAVTGNRGKRLNQYVADYVVFDLETTGISIMRDQIIEISAIKVRGHEEVERFSTLVNPKMHIPARASAVNGITDDMVAVAPVLAKVLPDFMDFIGKDVLVGHNIHTFDLGFLCLASEDILMKSVGNDYVDTLYMARSCLPQLAHHRLLDVSEYFGISTEGAHRALNDCVMNQRCYEKLGRLLGDAEILTCPKCGGELMKRNGKFGVFFGCGNYPVCRYTKNIR